MSVATAVPVRSGREEGIEWKVLISPRRNCLNGYARIPAGHPWAGQDFDEIERTNDVVVHGGLTFAGEGWIGFDTAHYQDYWPTEELERVGGQRTAYEFLGADRSHVRDWTLEQIVDEAKALARQVAEATR